jgi:hypothetical protein
MAVRRGLRVATHYGSVATETAVCLRSVGLADRFGRLTFDLRGAPDLVDAALARVARLGDGAWHVRVGANHAVVRCEPSEEEHCRDMLDDRDLVLTEPTQDSAALGLVGPRAGDVLRDAHVERAPFPATAMPDPTGFEVLVPSASGPAAWSHLLRCGEHNGIACVGFDALEHLAVSRHVARL